MFILCPLCVFSAINCLNNAVYTTYFWARYLLINVAAESPIKRFLLFMLCHVIFMCLCNLCLCFRLVLLAHYALEVTRYLMQMNSTQYSWICSMKSAKILCTLELWMKPLFLILCWEHQKECVASIDVLTDLQIKGWSLRKRSKFNALVMASHGLEQIYVSRGLLATVYSKSFRIL